MSNRGSFGSYEQGGGGGGSNYSSYHSGGSPSVAGNDFTRLTQVIGNNIQKITQNVAQMQRLVNLIGTSGDNAELRDKLHQVQHYSNQLAKDTNKYIKDLAHIPLTGSQSEQKQCKIQRDRLMNEFTSGLNNFQGVQRRAAEKEKDSFKRARAHSGKTHDPFADERKSDDQLVGFDSPTKQQSLQMEEDVDLEMLHEREQAIKKLESDITDVNSIFKDLGMLVHEQGEVIDSIEANVENAQVHVHEGTGQLAQASNYQKKSRRKMCLIITVVVVIVLVLILIIYLASK